MTEPNFAERRKSPRTACRGEHSWKLTLRAPVRLLDISAGGALLASDVPVPLSEGRLRVRRVLRNIREQANALLASRTTARPRVLYGGGVTPGTITTLTRELDADGFFVGRASVQVASFLRIVDSAHEAITFSHQ